MTWKQSVVFRFSCLSVHTVSLSLNRLTMILSSGQTCLEIPHLTSHWYSTSSQTSCCAPTSLALFVVAQPTCRLSPLSLAWWVLSLRALLNLQMPQQDRDSCLNKWWKKKRLNVPLINTLPFLSKQRCFSDIVLGAHFLFVHLFNEFMVHSHHLSIHNVADNCIVWAEAKFRVLINRALTPALVVLAVWFVVTRRRRLPRAPPTIVHLNISECL